MKLSHSTHCLISFLALLALPLSRSSFGAAAAPLLIDGPVITLPDSAGKFDFLEIDPTRHRLLGAHEKDDTADFFDLNTLKVIARLKLGSVVHIITDPETGRYFASAQGEQTVIALDADSLKETGRVKLPGELDALVLVPHYHRVYAAHDNGSHLWAIDTQTLALAAEVVIPGAPEMLTYDASADRIYLNIKTKDEVVVIDPGTNQIAAHWPTAPAKSPHGIALDAARSRLYVAGGNGKLVALDLKSGQVVSSVEIAKTVDQAAFDPKANRLYCAGAEELSVVRVSDSGLELLGSIATNKTARNVAVDQVTGDVWTTYTDGKESYAKSWKQP
jgi:DNA-binding beta-propeller fold protein YncE